MLSVLLRVLSLALFKAEYREEVSNHVDLLAEAKAQSVFPIVYSAISEKCDLSKFMPLYYSMLSQNIQVIEEHKNIHKLLSENNIPYVFLKGCASARYYPDPLLRTMGDVDLLILPQDTEKADKLLTSNGFKKFADSENEEIHIAYKSESGVICELHRKINGIPKNEVGQKIYRYLSDIIENSVLVDNEFICPNDFHHGLILLLHTASHLTKEGVGLRHLCDWAVFVEKFSEQEFCGTFKNALKEIGLWKFACVLTACCVKYLGCEPKEWTGAVSETLIDGIIEDIFAGGNFGKKDYSRYQQIKYISDSKNHEISKSHPVLQVFKNLISKAKSKKLVKKNIIFLPLGCAWVSFNYLLLIFTGKRKLDSKKAIEDARKRKNIYSEFKLFETQQNTN